MNAALEKYLSTVDKCLKPLSTSERVDIVKEIKSSVLEMESEHLSTEQIMERLGKPKELARAYLGDLLTKKRIQLEKNYDHLCFLQSCGIFGTGSHSLSGNYCSYFSCVWSSYSVAGCGKAGRLSAAPESSLCGSYWFPVWGSFCRTGFYVLFINFNRCDFICARLWSMEIATSLL